MERFEPIVQFSRLPAAYLGGEATQSGVQRTFAVQALGSTAESQPASFRTQRKANLAVALFCVCVCVRVATSYEVDILPSRNVFIIFINNTIILR